MAVEKVNVWAEYHWECPKCGNTVSLPYQPKLKGKITCPECEHIVVCDEITESVRPEY